MSFILYIKHRFIFAAFCLSAFTLDQMYFVFVKLKENKPLQGMAPTPLRIAFQCFIKVTLKLSLKALS